MNKLCTRCNRSLPIISFYKNIQSKDGFGWRCKYCIQEINYLRIEKKKELDQYSIGIHDSIGSDTIYKTNEEMMNEVRKKISIEKDTKAILKKADLNLIGLRLSRYDFFKTKIFDKSIKPGEDLYHHVPHDKSDAEYEKYCAKVKAEIDKRGA